MSFTIFNHTQLSGDAQPPYGGNDSAYYPCRRKGVQILSGLLWRVECGRKKEVGPMPRRASAQPRIPQESPKRPRGRQPSHVHATVACLYSEAWLAVAHLRSARAN